MELTTVMVSSTILDLPKHRRVVNDAICNQNMHPVVMENLPASWNDAKTESIKLVNKSDIYILIIGIRYGDVWDDSEGKSLTEIEYDYALEHNKKPLVFIASDNHLFSSEELRNAIPNFEKFTEFKKKVSDPHINIVKQYDSAEQLENLVGIALSCRKEESSRAFSLFPKPPCPYIAHPYTLLDREHLVGRNYELNLLDDWINKNISNISRQPFLNFISIGGMGKSALTWAWFNKIINDNKYSNFDGFIWWSFYESDASFSSFVINALAYVTGESFEKISKLDVKEREDALILALSQLKYLIVLDGIERILLAYSRLDAAKLSEDNLEEKTNDFINTSYTNKLIKRSKDYDLRKFSEIRATLFFNKLLNISIKSNFLISSRLLPSIFEATDFDTYNSKCLVHYLKGLKDCDALELWRKYKVNGDDQSLLTLFRTFNNYPLLIRILATEIKDFRQGPGDYYKWLKMNPDFNPYALDLIQVKNHVLYYALKGLDDKKLRVLETICAFRSPIKYSILVRLAVNKIVNDNEKLDNILKELEQRGLIGWNRNANTYDSHPIVRGVTWSSAKNEDRINILSSMTSLFKEMPINSQWEDISSEQDLSIPIEHFNALVGLKEYETAFDIFYDKLNIPTNYKLNANNLRIKLLETFFKDENYNYCFLEKDYSKAFVYNSLAISLDCIGDLKKADTIYKRLIDLQNDQKSSETNLHITYLNYCDCLINQGKLNDAESNIRKATIYFHKTNRDYEAISIGKLARILNLKGMNKDAKKTYLKSIELFKEGTFSHPIVSIYSNFFEFNIVNKSKNLDDILLEINRIIKIYGNYERQMITYKRIYARFLMYNGENALARQSLDKLLIHVRKVQFMEEELNILLLIMKLSINDNDDDAFEEYFKETYNLAKDREYILVLAEASILCSEFYYKKDREKSLDFAHKAMGYSLSDNGCYLKIYEMAKGYIEGKPSRI